MVLTEFYRGTVKSSITDSLHDETKICCNTLCIITFLET